MPKTRMLIDDIHAMMGSVRKNILNMRVTNIYNLQNEAEVEGIDNKSNQRTYIFKLHQPPFPKVYLLIESGVRFHSSNYARNISSSSTLPNQFTMKLRKHIRGKRLMQLEQLKGDRVIDFTFGSDQSQCHLILELYASGNIILTDNQYNILSLLRTHRIDENVKVAVRQVYPIQILSNRALESQVSGQILRQRLSDWFSDQSDDDTTKNTARGGKKKFQTLEQLLLTKSVGFGGLGRAIVEHCIVSTGIPNSKIKSYQDVRTLEDHLGKLAEELNKGIKLLQWLENNQEQYMKDEQSTEILSESEKKPKGGYIILGNAQTGTKTDTYESFTPVLYAQHREKAYVSFDTFDQTVDEYFSYHEARKTQTGSQAAQQAASSKLEKMRKNQIQQLDELHHSEEINLKHAQLIELHQLDIEKVLSVIRSALASGMDWKALKDLVKYEQTNANPVASMIHEFDLSKNRVSVLLSDDPYFEDAEPAVHAIWLDLSLSALGNAAELYAKKKTSAEKAKKAEVATEKAIKLAASKTEKFMKTQLIKPTPIHQRRKTFWFEKFHWFLSSENILVISGKDAQQNELLVNRYVRKNDVFVHSDLQGASPCIVRVRAARTFDQALSIPITTLEQAACMCVCRSNAWKNQVITGAYWVKAECVSKSTSSGELLPPGTFLILGKKNFLQALRLEMGLAILYHTEEGDAKKESGTGKPLQPRHEEVVDESSSNCITIDAHEELPSASVKTLTGMEDVTDQDNENDAMECGDHGTKIIPSEKSEMLQPELEKLSVHDEAGEPSANTSMVDTRDSDHAENQSQQQTGSEKSTPQHLVDDATQVRSKSARGKKGKLKKIKQKYADQDEEDRLLRMEALGHKKSVISEPTPLKLVPSDGTAAVNTHSVKMDKQKVYQGREQYLKEEEEFVDALDFSVVFTGSPKPNSRLIAAIPMCAPYSALQKYTYRVKLVPGAQKLGKAARQIIAHFFTLNLQKEESQSQPRALERTLPLSAADGDEPDRSETNVLQLERELLKSIPEHEFLGCMIGQVRVVAPGGLLSAQESTKKVNKSNTQKNKRKHK
uniref:Uncharacterized protein AlNc14C82G5341 n=1 Tax=Albugo laibachii Nc14 TaxID=890382 RepID=F0WFF2_9STRA|nr:conserved hypothetical protein [Albugo laibachii Nc14]|eukprot:CCA19934.1 conserved hypothetical protein [Albugo laibachii Nc14]